MSKAENGGRPRVRLPRETGPSFGRYGATDFRDEGALLLEPLYQAARPKIAVHVRQLQDARTLRDLFEAERALLVEFAARQRVADTLPGQRDRLEREIRKLASKGSRNEMVETQRQLDVIKRQQQVSRSLQHALRRIADGLAWKALRYDRLAIAVFGQGRRVGRLSAGVGFEAELAAMESFWERGILAIHNDMTNVLRHGDLTAVRWPRGGDLEVDVVEVKAGRADPGSAQMRRIGAAIEFLQKGEHPSLADGERLTALRLPQRYRTFQTGLRDVIGKARRKGFAWVSPSPAIAIMVIDFTRAGGRVPEIVQPGHEAMERRLGWWSAGKPLPFVWGSGLQRMQDRRETVAGIAPFSIFRFPPEDVADILLGFVDYIVYLNDPVLELMFAREGIQARVARPPESERIFLTARRGSAEIHVPAALRQQMMIELMTPASLIVSVNGALAAAARQNDRPKWLVVFADESSVWGAGST